MANMAKRVDVGDKGKYRKVDVDAIDEDLYRDEDTDDSGLEQLVAQRAGEVRALLGKGGNVREAVAKALESPPLGSKNQALKVPAPTHTDIERETERMRAQIRTHTLAHTLSNTFVHSITHRPPLANPRACTHLH
jgi:hypothetical protein